MGNFRFYRRKQIFPGLSVNLSKSGASLTFGVRGAHLTVGRRGVRRTVGIPGTGLYYTSRQGNHSGVHSAHVETPAGAEKAGVVGVVADLIVALVGLAVLVGLGFLLLS